MASKRQRKESSSSVPPRPFDSRKFVSAEAEERFNKVLSNRPLIPERGLRPDGVNDGEMLDMIVKKGWDTFTDHPDPAVVSVVKEFYANAANTRECEVMVRGKTVCFSRAAINTYYNVRGDENSQFAEYVTKGPEYEAIVTNLCQPGTEWKVNKYTSELKSFPFKNLSRYGKIWYAFLCAKLMPSMHVSDVSRDRAVLLYAIIKEMSIDVGYVIEASIKKNLQGAISGGLPHPSLITDLCRRAGVRCKADEPLQLPTTLLDHNLIRRYKVWEGGESHPQGLGFILPHEPLQPDGHPRSPAQDVNDPVSLRTVRKLQKRMDSQFWDVVRSTDRIAERQDVMYAYTHTCTSALAAMLAQLNPSVALPQFPQPPPLPRYPPTDSDEDNDADTENDAEVEPDA